MLEHQNPGGVIFWYGDAFDEANLTFEVTGSASDPALICQFPDGDHVCTYTRQR